MKRGYIAEFIGSFALVLAAAGAATLQQGVVALALTQGLMLMALTYTLGRFSGQGFNPAIALAIWLSGHSRFGKMIGAIIAQILGGVFAAVVIWYLFRESKNCTPCTLLAESTLFWQGFVVEAFGVFFWALCYLLCAELSTEGLTLGAILATFVFLAAPVTGASFNPARTLGPALIAGVWDDCWIFLLAALAGAVAASIVARFFFRENKSAAI